MTAISQPSLTSDSQFEYVPGRGLGVNRRQDLQDLYHLVSLLRSTPSRRCQTRLRNDSAEK